MKRGFIEIAPAALLLGLAILGACDKSNDITAPPPYVPLIETLELTPSLDAGAPVALAMEGDRLAILYSAMLGGSGDIYRLVLDDQNTDGVYDSFALTEEYINENDSSLFYFRPDHDQFTYIGKYEIVTDGANGDTTIVNYPGNIYISGPRHLFYDPVSDRIFYSMGFAKVAQIGSTASPLDASSGHTGDIVNDFDTSLEEIFSNGVRLPIWDYWYTKVLFDNSFAFSGGYYAAVSPVMAGHQWLAYADTLLESFDRDGFDLGDSRKKGEDPPGEIDGSPGDGLPGLAGEDDDGDGGIDLADPEIAAVTAPGIAPAPPGSMAAWTYAWSVQYYDPARDDDEDGFMDEDWSEQVDQDQDGQFGEDGAEPYINQDGDDETDEDEIDGIDNDNDGLTDEDPSEQVDNDDDGRLNEDEKETFVDNDVDGRQDEDALGDMNGDGAPGVIGISDADDDFADLLDPQVRHSLLRAERKNEYDSAPDDDEDGLADEDGDVYRNGLWVVRLGEGGLPDPTAVPISITNDGERQPFFHPIGADPDIDLLYVQGGDIHRLSLTFTADDVTVTGTENLTNSATLDAYPSYSSTGDDRIVFSSSLHGTADIWILEPDGNRARVTNAPGQELYPRFTPNGKQILYEAWIFPGGMRRVMITTGELP